MCHKYSPRSYKEYRDKQEALHAAWEERQKEREAKIAQGEKVGPPEPDPTAQHEVGLLGLLKFFLYLFLFAALAGKFVTGSYTWDIKSKWLQIKNYKPVSPLSSAMEITNLHLLQQTNDRLFSERWLAEFDGRIPGRPIYLAAS